MIEQLFNRCILEIRQQNFNRLSFLKIASELAPKQQARLGLLAIYSFYHFFYHQNFIRSLQCIEQAMNLKPDDVTTSILFAVKGAVLTNMDKHSQGLQLLKEAVTIASNAVFIKTKNYVRNMFPFIISKVLGLCNMSRGRREFLLFLDKIRALAMNFSQLKQIQQISQQKTLQIRDVTRGAGKHQYQNQSNDMQFSKNKEPAIHTSIYISRLYEQRKFALGKRQNSNKKGVSPDPYQLSFQERGKQRGNCQYM